MLSKISGDYIKNVAFYLTWDCNLSCSYCLNRQGLTRYLPKKGRMKPDLWIRAANRFSPPGSPPVVLQGGEPTLYPGLVRIIRESDPGVSFEIKTNLNFDTEQFMADVPAARLAREGIIATYHPEQMRARDLAPKIKMLRAHGYPLTLYAVYPPRLASRAWLLLDREILRRHGIKLHFKPFVGFHRGRVYGEMRYPGAVDSPDNLQQVQCRTCEILVGPGGQVYRCYAAMFGGWPPIAHILDDRLSEETIKAWRKCDRYGQCSPCNIKARYDPARGLLDHASAEIIL